MRLDKQLGLVQPIYCGDCNKKIAEIVILANCLFSQGQCAECFDKENYFPCCDSPKDMGHMDGCPNSTKC